MDPISLMPIAGMNTEAEDAALQRGGDAPRLFVRDALNVDISPEGKIDMRGIPRKVSDLALANLWTSPLHGDTFATLGDQWVTVDPVDWRVTPIATIGAGRVTHEVLNNLVCAAGPAGIFTYDGKAARRLAIDTPPAPLVSPAEGSLAAGCYGVAVSWLRDEAESSVSDVAQCALPDGGGLDITLPWCMDPAVTHVRLYMTRQNGGELARVETLPIDTLTFGIPAMPALGMPPQFRHMEPMPTGAFFAYWRGRLVSARANVLRFSEALAYHLHDPRHGFVQLAQRITFIVPVSGGLWVGQVDHVVFLAGDSLESLQIQRTKARAPVPCSALAVGADVAGAEASQGGQQCALWLADNGYVIGTPAGQVVEPHSGVLAGISGQCGASVVFDERALTVVA